MAASWPSTLPQEPFAGYTKTRLPNIVKSDNDSGPPKIRRRSTKAREIFKMAMELTGAEVAIFEAFFRDDLEDGTLTFTWIDPVTDAAAEFRFYDGRCPELPNTIAAPLADDRLYEIVMELEVV
jgi:hypothetical protein